MNEVDPNVGVMWAGLVYVNNRTLDVIRKGYGDEND